LTVKGVYRDNIAQIDIEVTMGLTEQSTPLPAWMERIKQEDELAEARAEAETQRDRAANLQLAAEAPIFWATFVRELKFQAPLLDAIGIRASVSLSLASDVTPDDTCHVEVAKKDSLIPRVTIRNFFYGKGNRGIRVYDEGRNFIFNFVIYPEGVKVQGERSSDMDAEEMAEFTLQRMVQSVR
jgi:hypothetical protein